jgi:hypothetical protein
MKIEDAIALLIDCTDLICRECNDRHRGCKKQKSYPDFASTVLAALEKQIPKEPTRYTCENDTCYNHTKCQVCGGGLDSTEKFCRDCGQAIKWR